MHRKYACYICSKEVVNIGRHVNIHTGQKKLTCLICEQVFGRDDKLKRHSFIHKLNKFIYTCERCKKTFQRSDKLRRHMTVHSSLKPYICQICKICYKWKDTLTRHTADRHSQIKRESMIKTE